MRVSNSAALTAVLALAPSSRHAPAAPPGVVAVAAEAAYLPTSDGYSSGSCLGGRFLVDRPPGSPTAPTCAGGVKFWKSISLNVPPTCVAGRRLAVGRLSFESSFDADAYDFAVSSPEHLAGDPFFSAGGVGVDWDGR